MLKTKAQKLVLPVLALIFNALLILSIAKFITPGITISHAQALGTPVKVVKVIPKPSPQLIIGKPVKIEFPSINTSVELVDGYYYSDTKTWTLNDTKAQYAVMTTQANNDSGNTFIYGHNSANIFKNLPKLKMGDTAIVSTGNGHIFYYKLREFKDVKPNNIDFLLYQGPPILSVQTCSGTWYENRRIFTFDLERAQ